VSPTSNNFAGRTVRNVCSGHMATSSTTSMDQAEAPQGCAGKVSTPFSDLLTTMIEAHAAESARALENAGTTRRIGAIPNIADAINSRGMGGNAARGRRARQPNVHVVGLVVALGTVFYVPEAGNERPSVFAADQVFQVRSVLIGDADANAKPIGKPLQAGEPDRSGIIGVEEEPKEKDGIESKSASGTDSNDQAVVTPVVAQPSDKLVSDTENRADGAAGERLPSEAVRTDPIAPATKASTEEPARDASTSPPLARKTGSVIGGDNDPGAIQVARVISGANMRAGPSNGQPVLATIPGGSSVEVVKCHHWCEVVFTGQRGWVYKSFVRLPPADAATLPERTRPNPRKAGSNRGVLRGTRTGASSIPHKPKPRTARLSADQSTRDVRSRSQSSDRPTFPGSIFEYLWGDTSR
jgi:hypothetical protein